MTERRYPRRVDILGSPWQWTTLGVGDPARDDRYRRLVTIARVNLPRRMSRGQRYSATIAVRDALISRTIWE